MEEKNEIKGLLLLGSSATALQYLTIMGAITTGAFVGFVVSRISEGRSLRKQNKKLSKSIKEFCKYVKTLKEKES